MPHGRILNIFMLRLTALDVIFFILWENPYLSVYYGQMSERSFITFSRQVEHNKMTARNIWHEQFLA